MVAALGITWILDGLEVTLAGSLSGALKNSPTLQFSNADIGIAASAYLAGAVLGALFFGWLTDRIGRKKLFFVTLAVYLLATAATAFSWNLWSFALFRFLTGAGIGGEYTAINSTIQELVPARYRGWTDLVINGSFWIGAAIGAVLGIVLLNPAVIDPELGWRVAFLAGAILGLIVFLMRFWIPESPRWLMIHGQPERAQAIVADIERGATVHPDAVTTDKLPTIRLRMRTHTPLMEVAHTLIHAYRSRTILGLGLMTAQAFFYNAIFFTYALILTDFYGIAADHVGWYLLPFAAGNFLGPLLLGRLFDTLGRRIDDHGDLFPLRRAAGDLRLSVLDRRAHRADADDRLDDHLLLRLACGERRLPHRERNVPARSESAGDRHVLCDRHRGRRRRRAGAVWRPDRHRVAHERVRRISLGVGADDRCGVSCMAALHCLRTHAT